LSFRGVSFVDLIMNDPFPPLAPTGPSFVRTIRYVPFFGHGGAVLIFMLSYFIQREISKV